MIKCIDILIALASAIIAVYLLATGKALWPAITVYWCLVAVRNCWKVVER